MFCNCFKGKHFFCGWFQWNSDKNSRFHVFFGVRTWNLSSATVACTVGTLGSRHCSTRPRSLSGTLSYGVDLRNLAILLKIAIRDNCWLFLSLKDTWYVDQTTPLGHLPIRPADLGPFFCWLPSVLTVVLSPWYMGFAHGEHLLLEESTMRRARFETKALKLK